MNGRLSCPVSSAVSWQRQAVPVSSAPSLPASSQAISSFSLKNALAHLPEALDGTKSILFYPVLGLVLIGVIMTYIINPPTSVFNTWLFDVLNSMTTSSRIVLGFILGGMMSIDFGGPIN